jgi:holo-[acyl-carrier protein] synthase
MKLATGVDLIEVERVQKAIDRHGERFLGKVFTPTEVAESRKAAMSLAATFAAKEAVAKALGTGIGLVGWQEIEILHDAERQPVLSLHGVAALIAAKYGLTTWSISLSHTASHAIALVVAVGEE